MRGVLVTLWQLLTGGPADRPELPTPDVQAASDRRLSDLERQVAQREQQALHRARLAALDSEWRPQRRQG
jgi:hypothetical protein